MAKGLDSAQSVRGIGTRVLFVLVAVLALLLLGAISSPTARADLLDSVGDLTPETVDNTTASVAPLTGNVTESAPLTENVVEVLLPIVEDIVEVLPPVVELVPPVVESVVELVPPVVESVVELVPPVVESVVELVPPLVTDVFDDVGTTIRPVESPNVPSGLPNGGETTASGPGSAATSRPTDQTLYSDESLFDQPPRSGVSTSRPHGTFSDADGWSPAIAKEGSRLFPYGPTDGQLPASLVGHITSLLSGSSPSGPRLVDGGIDALAVIAALAALIAVCSAGFVHDQTRASRSNFPRHQARPG